MLRLASLDHADSATLVTEDRPSRQRPHSRDEEALQGEGRKQAKEQDR